MKRVVLNINSMVRLVNDDRLYQAIPEMLPLKELAGAIDNTVKTRRGCRGCRRNDKNIRSGDIFLQAGEFLKKLKDDNQLELLDKLKDFLHVDEVIFYMNTGKKTTTIYI